MVVYIDGVSENSGSPNCLVVFWFGLAIFEEAILTHFDSGRRLSNSEHWVSHLRAVALRVMTVAAQSPTSETQLFMILAMSRPASVLFSNNYDD